MSTAALDTALAFLDALHGGAPGMVELRLRSDRPGALLDRRYLRLPGEGAALGHLLARNAVEPSALLFSVNPRATLGGSDGDVQAVVAVVVDLDGKGLSTDEQKGRLRRVLDHAPAAATVRSGSAGHGHVYWTFHPADPEQARSAVRRLRSWLAADPTEGPSRMMRLPGSANWKSNPPVPIEVLYLADPVPRLALSDFIAALDAASVPALPAAATRPRLRPAPAASAQVIAAVAACAADVRAILAALPMRLAETCRTGSIAGYLSRSERDLAVVRALVELGLSDGEIVAFFEPLPVGDKVRESPASYLITRTIETARSTQNPAGDVALVQVQDTGGAFKPGARAWIRLETLDGRNFSQGVKLAPELWGYIWTCAALPVPSFEAPLSLRALIGRRLRVRLGGTLASPQVRSFLPPGAPV